VIERSCFIYIVGRMLDKGVQEERCLATPRDRQDLFR